MGARSAEFRRALRLELANARDAAGVATDADLGAAQLQDLVHAYKKVFLAHTGRDFPQAPHEQLFLGEDVEAPLTDYAGVRKPRPPAQPSAS